MPFKSEKQRRFLWAKHPEIAKRWADEYPGQKNLPMYANQGEEEPAPDKEKVAFILPGKKLTFPFYTSFFPNTVFPMKQANSMQYTTVRVSPFRIAQSALRNEKTLNSIYPAVKPQSPRRGWLQFDYES